ncbi:MAG: hypothetical protein OXG78_16860 [Chloroflexi bacterium]|nr:hypothetical protein [Chloroflexota bacterium]
MLSGLAPTGNDGESPAEESGAEAASIIDLMMRQARNDLDKIDEPTAADLDAIDELGELDAIDDLTDAALLDPPAQTPRLNPALALLAEIEEPELVSLESLDDAEPLAALEEDIDDVEGLLDDVESLIEDYVDLDLEDDELEDEGYDLDDDDLGSYRDLYGDDDAIIPSFREGEFAEEDEADTEYYDDMR